jgi:flagellar biosynthetic protein FlhB
MAESNKTEKATPQRRKKAREQGQIARSRELPNVLALFGIAGALLLLSNDMAAHWTRLYRTTLEAASSDNFSADGPILFWSSIEVLRWIVPALLVALLLSVAAGLAQGGFNLAPGALTPKFDRFNPASRLGQIFSLTSLSHLLKSLLPFAVILVLGVTTMREHWGELVRSSQFDVRSLTSIVMAIAFTVSWKSGLVLLAWAGVDYGLTWRKTESDLRMSKDEIRKEHKETDGNPIIKGQIRKLQRAMRRKQSLKAAATATIVVTNPTHYAVALKYEPAMAAPEVVAKGRDLLAQQIKQIARDSGVMVMENKPLAQALYKSVEVGDTIPAQLYQAVAEILVIVFRAQADLREQENLRRRKNAAGEVVE